MSPSRSLLDDWEIFANLRLKLQTMYSANSKYNGLIHPGPWCVWDPLPARLYNVQIKVHRFMGFYKCKSKWQIFIGVPSHCWRRLWLYWHWTLIIVPRISAPKPQDWQRARSLGFFYVISAFVRIRTILYKNFKTWFPTNPWNEYGFQQSSKHSNSKALRC